MLDNVRLLDSCTDTLWRNHAGLRKCDRHPRQQGRRQDDGTRTIHNVSFHFHRAPRKRVNIDIVRWELYRQIPLFKQGRSAEGASMRRRARNRNPEYWRARAEKARTVAESLAHAECKRLMLQVADDYEKLANRADEREVPVGRRPARTVGTLTA
jgi:hypothetical protein